MKLIGPPTARDGNARPGRRGWFAASVAVALALNVAVLALAAASVQRWRAPANAARQMAWVTAVVDPPPPANNREPTEAPLPSRATVPFPQALPTLPPPKADSPSATPKSPPAQTDEDRVVRFYKYREVDRIAEPDSDWDLDAALLDGAGVQTLTFEIFIDAAGAVVSCTILAPSDLPDETRSLLEARLRSTVMQPATRGGRPVASVRRIEVSVQSDGQ